jgi:hypothetical protein
VIAVMPDLPKLDYAVPEQGRIRRATWRDHLMLALLGLIGSIIVGVVLVIFGWISTRY